MGIKAQRRVVRIRNFLSPNNENMKAFQQVLGKQILHPNQLLGRLCWHYHVDKSLLSDRIRDRYVKLGPNDSTTIKFVHECAALQERSELLNQAHVMALKYGTRVATRTDVLGYIILGRCFCCLRSNGKSSSPAPVTLQSP